jgi:hypothetical protein
MSQTRLPERERRIARTLGFDPPRDSMALDAVGFALMIAAWGAVIWFLLVR